MKLKILFFLSITLFAPAALTDKADTKKISMEIIAALSDDIAELVIARKQDHDPRQTKVHCINIIRHMTEVVALIIATVQERQQMRSLELYDEQNQAAIIEQIVDQILERTEE